MSGMPLVTIIVPVYNAEQYLCECLDSLINQTYTNLEILVVDDGSSDSSGEICDQYAKKDHRIMVVHKENGGVSSARNAALAIAHGDYYHFCDADDWMELNTYEVLINDTLQYEVDLCVFNAFIHRGVATPVPRIRNLPAGKYNKIALLKYSAGVISKSNKLTTCFLCMTNKLFKSTLFVDTNNQKMRFDETMTHLEDGSLLVDTFVNWTNCYIDSHCFYHIRYHERSAMGSLENEKMARQMLNGYEQIVQKKAIQENNIALNYMHNAYSRAALYYLTLCAQDGAQQAVAEIKNRFADDAAFQERAHERLLSLAVENDKAALLQEVER